MEDSLLVILNFILFLSIFGPVTTFIHELARAIVVLISTNNKVNIKLGIGKKPLTLSTSRMNITIYPCSGWSGYTTFDNYEKTNRKILLFFYLFGPLFSFLTCLSFYIFLNIVENGYWIYICKFMITTSFVQFLITIIPIHYNRVIGGGYATKSDGMKLKELLLHNRSK